MKYPLFAILSLLFTTSVFANPVRVPPREFRTVVEALESYGLSSFYCFDEDANSFSLGRYPIDIGQRGVTAITIDAIDNSEQVIHLVEYVNENQIINIYDITISTRGLTIQGVVRRQDVLVSRNHGTWVNPNYVLDWETGTPASCYLRP